MKIITQLRSAAYCTIDLVTNTEQSITSYNIPATQVTTKIFELQTQLAKIAGPQFQEEEINEVILCGSPAMVTRITKFCQSTFGKNTKITYV